MRCTGFLAVVTLIGLLATSGPLGAQATKDPIKDKEKKDKEADPPSYVGGKTLADWVKELKNPDPSVRQNAIQMVVQFGPPAKLAVPTLINYSLKEQDASIRGDAAAALGMIGAMERAVDSEEMPKVVTAL